MAVMFGTAISYNHHRNVRRPNTEAAPDSFPELHGAVGAPCHHRGQPHVLPVVLGGVLLSVMQLLHGSPHDVRLRTTGHDSILLDCQGPELVPSKFGDAEVSDGPEHGGQRGVLPEPHELLAHHAVVLHHCPAHITLDPHEDL